MNNEKCRLCESEDLYSVSVAKVSAFSKCANCDYVQRVQSDFLSYEAEKGRYLQHKNSIEDKGYVEFLARLTDPLTNLLSPESAILDYGSGPNPVLKEIMSAKGFEVCIYDPFFAPDMPKKQFDAVSSTEVFEHFRHPKLEIEKILGHLKNGGYLGVETLLYSENTNFSEWHYVRDPTHVGFFSSKTFNFIENKYGLKRVFDDGERVLILRK